MNEGDAWFESVAARMTGEMANGLAPRPEQLTVRELLAKFDYRRRSDHIARRIRKGLKTFNLRADRSVSSAPIDSTITIELDFDAQNAPVPQRTTDPTHRVSALLDRTRKLESVKPESTLASAKTKLRLNHYSRLPVMRHDRDVTGIITWKSIANHRTADDGNSDVRACTHQAEVVSVDARLFDAIRKVVEHGQVLVRDEENRITGIVTPRDVARKFEELAGPFLFIGEIEKHMRNLIRYKFTLDELREASVESASPHSGRVIRRLDDLTFAEYRAILGNKNNWERLNLDIDRGAFIGRLEEVQRIRNAVMHFNPEALDGGQRERLRRVARFFEKLVRVAKGDKR